MRQKQVWMPSVSREKRLDPPPAPLLHAALFTPVFQRRKPQIVHCVLRCTKTPTSLSASHTLRLLGSTRRRPDSCHDAEVSKVEASSLKCFVIGLSFKCRTRLSCGRLRKASRDPKLLALPQDHMLHTAKQNSPQSEISSEHQQD